MRKAAGVKVAQRFLQVIAYVRTVAVDEGRALALVFFDALITTWSKTSVSGRSRQRCLK